MRIKETHTSPGIEVLEDEIPKEGALAESCVSDHVEVLRPVLGRKQNKLLLVRDLNPKGSSPGSAGVAVDV
jgi:hypothetical protein